MSKYDYLIVGAGLYGAVFAQQATERGKRCLVIDKRNHIAGNAYTEDVNGIQVHRYGAHIFHTSSERVWNYVNRFARFNNFINSPVAISGGKLYSLPFNMHTFYQMWDVLTPAEAQAKIAAQREAAGITVPKNLEEQAISLVGEDIYRTLIKGYTEKQWGRDCKDLPPDIIKRLPVRFTYNNNYFNDRWQGIPEEGYTKMVAKILNGVDVRLNVDFFENRDDISKLANKIIFTGPIDAWFNYCYDSLAYRSLKFETEELDIPNYQGVAVVNYCEKSIPFTRIIEHKHFSMNDCHTTIITREYPHEWKLGEEPYYPINDSLNNSIYQKYFNLSKKQHHIFFGGRLGQYKYFNMDQVILSALNDSTSILG